MPPSWTIHALMAALIFAIIPMAGLLPMAACLIALVVLVLAVTVAIRARGDVFPVPPIAVAFGLAALACLFQCIPLPLALLQLLAPRNASLWLEATTLTGQLRTWLPIALAPEICLVEAAKWLGYAATGWISFVWARAHGCEKLVRIVLGASIFAGISTVLHGLVDAHRVWGIYKPIVDFPRWTMGPILNVNHLSALLSLGVFCGLALLFSRRTITTVSSLLLMASTTLLMVGVVMLASRAAVGLLVLGVVTGVVVRAIGRKRQNRGNSASVVLVPSLLVASIALAFLGYHESIISGLQEKDLSKLRLVRDALPMVRDHWFAGVGRGGFESAFFAYRLDPTFDSWTHAENLVVQWTSEWGVPMASLIAGLLVLGVADARAWRESTMMRIVALGLGVLTAHNLFDFSLEVPAIAMPAAVLLGGMMGTTRSAATRRWTRWEISRTSTLGRGLGGGLVAVACLAVALPLVRGSERLDRVRSTVFSAAVGSPMNAKALAGAAMRRFPADPYMPYVGAVVVAREQPLEAMPWFNAALERAPRTAEIHLALADNLSHLGANKQALMHVKMVLQHDPRFLDACALRVAKYAADSDTILSFVEGNPPWESRFLSATLRALSPDSPLRESLRLVAIERDSCGGDERIGAVRQRLEAFARGTPECMGDLRAGCVKGFDEEIQQIATCPEKSREAGNLRVEFLWVTDQKKQSLELREETCALVDGAELTGCLQRLVEMAASIQDLDRVRRNLRVVVSRFCNGSSGCAKGWQWAASIHTTCKDPFAAYAALVKASELDPGDLEIRVLLADAAMKAGANEKAITALTYVLSRRPDDAVARQKLDLAKTMPRLPQPVSSPSSAPAVAPTRPKPTR